jgi:quinol monooxygenase YgiN
LKIKKPWLLAIWAFCYDVFRLYFPQLTGVFMQHVLIIHEVDAYPAWKTIFDKAADIRKNAGEISYRLLRYDDDENTIVHFSAWSSLANARRFFESPELVEIRKKAGVKAPNFIYLQEIESGVL